MLWTLLLTLSAFQNPPQEQKCRVEGQVSSVAGAPLKRATVHLLGPSTYATQTDSQGKFLFENIAAGTYTLRAEHPGFIVQYYSTATQKPIARMSLDPGQEVKDVALKLTPQGMIFGKVVDDDGEPLPGAAVQALHWGFVNGKRQLQSRGGTTVQADGSFILGNLPEGRYYLSAEARAVYYGPELPGNSKPQDSYINTYFPSVPDESAASPVLVAAGAEIRGIEIHVLRGRAFEIRGKIENAPADSRTSLTLLLHSKDDSSYSSRRSAIADRKKGEFLFKGVPPGDYVIQTQIGGPAQDKDPVAGRLEVTVSDRNLENVAVSLRPAPAIAGSFKLEDGSPMTGFKQPPTLWLQTEGSFTFFRPQYNPDGTFQFTGISPELLRLQVSGLPDNNYVKEVRLDGQELKGRELDLTSGNGGEMEIVLSPNGAEVTGTVRDGDGKGVAGAIVQVVDKDGPSDKTANSDQNGSFDLKGLAPGEYQVFAWQDRGEEIISDPDFRKSFDGSSLSIRVAEKSRENVDLSLITKDAMDAAAAKLQ